MVLMLNGLFFDVEMQIMSPPKGLYRSVKVSVETCLWLVFSTAMEVTWLSIFKVSLPQHKAENSSNYLFCFQLLSFLRIKTQSIKQIIFSFLIKVFCYDFFMESATVAWII